MLVSCVGVVVLLTKVSSTGIIGQATKDGRPCLKSRWRPFYDPRVKLIIIPVKKIAFCEKRCKSHVQL